MHIMRRRGWEIAERLATPEALALRRRGVLAGALALSAGTLAAGSHGGAPRPGGRRRSSGAAAAAAAPLGATGPRNDKYPPGRAITEEKYATTYNNYYEFDDSKTIWRGGAEVAAAPMEHRASAAW